MVSYHIIQCDEKNIGTFNYWGQAISTRLWHGDINYKHSYNKPSVPIQYQPVLD